MRFKKSVLSLVLPAVGWTLSYNPTPTATIDAGIIVGKATALPNGLGPSVNQFLGIPFAQSPPERFSPPRNVAAFSTPLNATAWKPACIQQFRCK
jgi:acetylcholinesterase